jgi:hypothetical protein
MNASSLFGVQFSTDGALLIAHSSFSTNSYIIVFNVNTGNVLSARSYSDQGYDNYNFRIKSMILTSSP